MKGITMHPGWTENNLWKFEQEAALQFVLSDPLKGRPAIVAGVFHEPYPPGPPRLCWTTTRRQTTPELSGCLWAFLKLASAPDSEILRFAADWGPLGITDYGKPFTHRPDCMPLGWSERSWELSDDRFYWAGVRIGPNPVSIDLSDFRNYTRFWEPLAAWRFYARQFKALMLIAYQLERNQAITARLWAEAFPLSPFGIPDDVISGAIFNRDEDERAETLASKLARDPIKQPWKLLSFLVNEHLSDAQAVPMFEVAGPDAASKPILTVSLGQRPNQPWPNDRPKFDVSTLYAILVTQLASAIQDPRGLYECSICHNVLTGSGQSRRADRQKFCSESCRIEARHERQKLYARRYRAARKTSRPTSDGSNG
jgi:hypothetical protein